MATTPVKVAGFGTNVDATIDGDTLTLVIDLSKESGPTGTAATTGKVKNLTVAKTNGGAVGVPGKDGYKVQVNVYRAPSPAEAQKYQAALLAA